MASGKAQKMATAVTQIGITVGGFVDAGGVLGVEVRANFFQDGRFVELSSTAPFDITATQARGFIKQTLIDAGYGELLDTAKFRVVGA